MQLRLKQAIEGQDSVKQERHAMHLASASRHCRLLGDSTFP